jgi:cytochrome c553
MGWTIRSLGLVMAIAASAAAPPLAQAAGSAQAGAAKALTCQACHGPNGNSVNGQWPSLAGQNAAYIEAQLRQFHNKTRVDPTGLMPPQAAALSEQDIEDLATYFSLQTPLGLEAEPAYWQAGQKLYRTGDPVRQLPACISCHGPIGRGVPSAGYPQLRAQHEEYLIQQLTQFAADTRYTRDGKGQSTGGLDDTIMHTVAGLLTPQEMRDLASYVQGMR